MEKNILSMIAILLTLAIGFACQSSEENKPEPVASILAPTNPEAVYDLQIIPPDSSNYKFSIISDFRPVDHIDSQCEFDIELTDPIKLQGKVYEQYNEDNPLVASITAFLNGNLQVSSTTSDIDGAYELLLSPGDYLIVIEPASNLFPPFSKEEITLQGITTRNFEISAGYTISGIITGHQGSEDPISGLRVFATEETLGLTSSEAKTTESNEISEGYFEIKLVRGEYTLKVRPTEDSAIYPYLDFKGLTINGDKTDFNIQWKRDILPRSVGGKVTDGNSNPYGDFRVIASMQPEQHGNESELIKAPDYATATISYLDTYTTDSHGDFNFALPDGHYQFMVESPSDSDMSSAIYPGIDSLLEINNETSEDIDIALEPKINVSGIVYGTDNVVIPDVNIFATVIFSFIGVPYTTSTMSNSKGRWSMQLDVEPWVYKYMLSPPAGSNYAYSIMEDIETFEIVENRSIDFNLVKGAPFSGKILDENGLPVPFVTIRAVDEQGEIWGTASSDEDGNYRLVLPR
jgi:hypothetical protein